MINFPMGAPEDGADMLVAENLKERNCPLKSMRREHAVAVLELMTRLLIRKN
jgi:hypothetical protein